MSPFQEVVAFGAIAVPPMPSCRAGYTSGREGGHADFALGPIGQIARDNLERANAWYAGVFGLPLLYGFPNLVFFDCAGTRLMLEDRSILEEGNLRNDDPPHMIFKHPDGMDEWMAFLRDSE